MSSSELNEEFELFEDERRDAELENENECLGKQNNENSKMRKHNHTRVHKNNT
jgi:hypothetical protein